MAIYPNMTGSYEIENYLYNMRDLTMFPYFYVKIFN